MRQAGVPALGGGGINPGSFANARGLLAAARRGPPVVVITQRTGDRLAEMLRTELGAKAPRMVLLTGARVPRAALTGFDRVVTKPFSVTHLIDALRVLMRDRGSHTRLRS